MLPPDEEKVALIAAGETGSDTGSETSKNSFDTQRYTKIGSSGKLNGYLILLHLTLATLYTGLFWWLTIDYRKSALAPGNSLVYCIDDFTPPVDWIC